MVHNSSGCDGTMVLGIGEHSDALAKQLEGGYTFNGDDYAQVVGQVNGKPFAQWQAEVSNVLRSNGKVAISLKGFDGATPEEQFMSAYKAGRGSDWKATQWEMGQVGVQVQMGNLDWGNITFYDGGGSVVNVPEPNW
ncbi:polymorphic toxin type 27 domain-containing protein [Streptacidiphilus albus]|uniref:polymorphic toxin type 27 domain-containing protein n=1 Tax=Streptacidiphilus albus TaxID=105425 RepID=UPI001E57C192|nr:polymorphic toxin type 27 domain-containing protein [Streptacidiphilus albus]